MLGEGTSCIVPEVLAKDPDSGPTLPEGAMLANVPLGNTPNETDDELGAASWSALLGEVAKCAPPAVLAEILSDESTPPKPALPRAIVLAEVPDLAKLADELDFDSVTPKLAEVL